MRCSTADEDVARQQAISDLRKLAGICDSQALQHAHPGSSQTVARSARSCSDPRWTSPYRPLSQDSLIAPSGQSSPILLDHAVRPLEHLGRPTVTPMSRAVLRFTISS